LISKTRKAQAVWQGKLKTGAGTFRLGEAGPEHPFTFKARFEEDSATNPEELIGAAHAACFTMALTKKLEDAGHAPAEITTTAEVALNQVPFGFAITHIQLTTRAKVPGVGEDEFKTLAEDAKIGCPVSKALAGTVIDLDAKLIR
jgi:osmotically inducible protein OsmC